MEKKMETTIMGLRSRRNGKENGNYYKGFRVEEWKRKWRLLK